MVGELRVCIRAREGSWPRTLGACVKLVQEQGVGIVEGCVCVCVCVCVCSAMGTRVCDCNGPF